MKIINDFDKKQLSRWTEAANFFRNTISIPFRPQTTRPKYRAGDLDAWTAHFQETGEISYDAMFSEHLLNMVLDALRILPRDCPLEDRPIFVSFDAHADGVALPEGIREKYPDDITVVLQHAYWNLAVTDDGFSVKLLFNDEYSTITVPREAIRSFSDPSTPFGLQFSGSTVDGGYYDEQSGEPQGPDLFLSYARDDKKTASRFLEFLGRNQIDVFWDGKIDVGVEYRSVVSDRIKASQICLVLWSAQSINRDWVLAEAQIAYDHGNLFSIRVDGCEIPPPFSARNHFDFNECREEDFDHPKWADFLEKVAMRLNG